MRVKLGNDATLIHNDFKIVKVDQASVLFYYLEIIRADRFKIKPNLNDQLWYLKPTTSHFFEMLLMKILIVLMMKLELKHHLVKGKL